MDEPVRCDKCGAVIEGTQAPFHTCKKCWPKPQKVKRRLRVIHQPEKHYRDGKVEWIDPGITEEWDELD